MLIINNNSLYFKLIIVVADISTEPSLGCLQSLVQALKPSLEVNSPWFEMGTFLFVNSLRFAYHA